MLDGTVLETSALVPIRVREQCPQVQDRDEAVLILDQPKHQTITFVAFGGPDACCPLAVAPGEIHAVVGENGAGSIYRLPQASQFSSTLTQRTQATRNSRSWDLDYNVRRRSQGSNMKGRLQTCYGVETL